LKAAALRYNLYLVLIFEEILQSSNRIGRVLSGDRSAHFESFLHETELIEMIQQNFLFEIEVRENLKLCTITG
jgi:hypothetical protein